MRMKMTLGDEDAPKLEAENDETASIPANIKQVLLCIFFLFEYFMVISQELGVRHKCPVTNA
jgi:hypothetical protein